MGKIRNVDQATNRELDEYLNRLGWAENPFAAIGLLSKTGLREF